MDKTLLREQGILRLKRLAELKQLKQQKELHIQQQLFASNQWMNASTVGVTMSMAYELSTSQVLKQAWLEQKIVVIPKTMTRGQMDFHQLTQESPLMTTRFGVQEPANEARVSPDCIDLLIVPGLVFSETGYRIGFGGGYYDRYLADYRGATCSLVFSEQLMESWIPDSYDIPVQQLFVN